MSGGTITGNTAVKGGGGICDDNELYLNGNPTIENNTSNGKPNDVFLCDDKDLWIKTKEGGTPLDAPSPIGIYLD